MNSWQTLLLLDVARGRYLATRQATQYDHMAIWMLATEGMDAWSLIGAASTVGTWR